MPDETLLVVLLMLPFVGSIAAVVLSSKSRDAAAWVAGPVQALNSALSIIVTVWGIFSVAYSLRFIHGVFFGPPPEGLPRVLQEPPRWMRLPIEFLVLACLVVGILPTLTICWFAPHFIGMLRKGRTTSRLAIERPRLRIRRRKEAERPILARFVRSCLQRLAAV